MKFGTSWNHARFSDMGLVYESRVEAWRHQLHVEEIGKETCKEVGAGEARVEEAKQI